jgi:hypothetical protein
MAIMITSAPHATGVVHILMVLLRDVDSSRKSGGRVNPFGFSEVISTFPSLSIYHG